MTGDQMLARARDITHAEALLLTGYVSAKLGGADPGRAIVRNMLVASLAMTTTYLLGTVFAG